GLQDHAAVVRPIALQRQDQSLERARGTQMGGEIVAHAARKTLERTNARRRSAEARMGGADVGLTDIAARALDLPAALRGGKELGTPHASKRWHDGRTDHP